MNTPKLRKFAVERLTRGRVGSLAEEIKESLGADSTQLEPQATQIILEHAVRNVPYYRGYVNREFDRLPVINKTHIRDDMAAFLDRDVKLKDLSSASTSGSTGTPFTAYFDREKVLRHRASLIGSYRFMGADPFGPFVFSRAWSNIGPKQRLVLAAKGHLPYAGAHQDSMQTDEVVRWINRRSRVTIMGYSSYIEGLLRSIEYKGLTIKPGTVDAVIGGSEPASDYLESASRQLLGLTSNMRYSNMELGIIAVTGSNPSIYHVDTQSYYVEILEEDSDHPAEPGTLGRIVVTDLHNRAMPFLRYDTGDLGQIYVDRDGVAHHNRLVSIQGRRLDVLLAGTKDNPKKLHAMQVFWGVTSKITEIHQFQLRQHAIGRFTWILNAEKSPLLESRLRETLRDVVGSVEECNFAYVDEVPVMASGKRQFFINEMLEDPKE